MFNFAILVRANQNAALLVSEGNGAALCLILPDVTAALVPPPPPCCSRSTTRSGGGRSSRRSSATTTTSGWRWWRAGRWTSQSPTSTTTTTSAPTCSTAQVWLRYSASASMAACCQRWAHSVCVCACACAQMASPQGTAQSAQTSSLTCSPRTETCSWLGELTQLFITSDPLLPLSDDVLLLISDVDISRYFADIC